MKRKRNELENILFDQTVVSSSLQPKPLPTQERASKRQKVDSMDWFNTSITSNSGNVELIVQNLRLTNLDPLLQHSHPPLVLRHMIYQAMNEERTLVDKALDVLVAKNKTLRQVKIHDKNMCVQKDETIALVQTQDLLHALHYFLIKQYSDIVPAGNLELYTQIEQQLLPTCTDLFVNKHVLRELLQCTEKQVTYVYICVSDF